MGKLSNIRSRLKPLAPRLKRRTDAQGHSPVSEPWRKWYSLARWKALRIATFVRDGFACQMPRCGKVDGDTSRLVADHKIPHRGDAALFWDPSNVHTLCKPCHDRLKQAEEAAARARGG